jgi:hypothetical protein
MIFTPNRVNNQVMLWYKIKWMRSTANEIHRLYKTNTISFIRKSSMPPGRKATYGSFVLEIKEHKEEREHARLTVGGDQIEYPGDKSTRTAGSHINNPYQQRHINKRSKIPGGGYKNFYLNTPLTRLEYMVTNLSSLPHEIIDEFGLLELAHDGRVYI